VEEDADEIIPEKAQLVPKNEDGIGVLMERFETFLKKIEEVHETEKTLKTEQQKFEKRKKPAHKKTQKSYNNQEDIISVA
jgi:hypothetical protein